MYAIGDIHGETDLLVQLLRKIRDDAAERGPANTTIVILGDFIDRGAGAAELLMTFAGLGNHQVVILKGNHEATLVDAYRGDEEVLGFWLHFGGAATLSGLGVPLQQLVAGKTTAILATLRARLPAAFVDWLDRLPASWSMGDYYFVHAGVQPGVRLDQQDEADLLWIREPFLSAVQDYDKVVVHGHTVEPGVPLLGGNRIGVDTGGHEHGMLTALGLEGDRQWLLQTLAERDAAVLTVQ